LRAITLKVTMAVLVLGAVLHAVPVSALERLCDSSFEDCRSEVLDRILVTR
jgi:hypothetical protein